MFPVRFLFVPPGIGSVFKLRHYLGFGYVTAKMGFSAAC
jgi:hypothetical protein